MAWRSLRKTRRRQRLPGAESWGLFLQRPQDDTKALSVKRRYEDLRHKTFAKHATAIHVSNLTTGLRMSLLVRTLVPVLVLMLQLLAMLLLLLTLLMLTLLVIAVLALLVVELLCWRCWCWWC